MKKEVLEKIIPYYLKCMKDQNYQEIIDTHLSRGSNYLVMLIGEDLIYYNLLIGAAYQELGELYKANIYFENYLYLINAESLPSFVKKEGMENLKDMNDDQKKFLILLIEIQNLGLKYIPIKDENTTK